VSKIFTLTIGGEAGQGVKSTGLMLAKVAVRSGYHTFDYTEYPSLIRGGHNVMQVRISTEEVTAPSQKIDLLIALNQETIDRHSKELNAGAGIIFDTEASLNTSKIDGNIHLYAVPLSHFTNGQELLCNIAALGSALALLSGDLTVLKYLIEEEFKDKEAKVISDNVKAAELGYNFVRENFQKDILPTLKLIEDSPQKMIVNGNDASAIGAIAGGLQFAAIYPMSPINNILHILAPLQEKYQFIYKQPEDEISAINMTIGASFAGARSLTATSGGGFCLMAEGYGLAGMTETPLVIIEGMRGGPATGLPTWSEQGDLKFILDAHQGDFPKIVLAPGDSKEIFEMARMAFNLADKYQTPVVILTDKNICENDQSFEVFENSQFVINRGKFFTTKLESYRRYSLEEDGVSPRSIPGSSNFFLANSDEHTEEGFSSEEISDRVSQMKKRMIKLATCSKEDMPPPRLYGPSEAETTIVAWGSTKGSVLEALKSLPNVNFLHLTWLSPFPTESIKNILLKSRHIVDIENNYSGQLAEVICEKTGIQITDRLLKYDGRPIYPEEITEYIVKLSNCQMQNA